MNDDDTHNYLENTPTLIQNNAYWINNCKVGARGPCCNDRHEMPMSVLAMNPGSTETEESVYKSASHTVDENTFSKRKVHKRRHKTIDKWARKDDRQNYRIRKQMKNGQASGSASSGAKADKISSVEEALEIIEKRRESIRAKLLFRKRTPFDPGTKLLKPPTKLVEMVAQAITGSPDGLLQVQQIYTYLQNKYPFFRYMDRVAVNSWRSSIRHALYQKWFRKIRFDLSFINSKGCYWAINNKNNPKEWSLPDNTFFQSVEYNFYKEILEKRNGKGTASPSREEDDTDVDLLDSDLEVDIVQCPYDTPWAPRLRRLQGSVPSPIREPDPLLATCAADWNKNELCLSSCESGCGTMSPGLPSTEQLLSPCSDLDHCRSFKSKKPRKTVAGISMASPMLNWTPNWDEYGSYILSPQNIGTQKYLQGFPGGRIDSQLGELEEEEDDELICPDLEAAYRLIMEPSFDLPVKICSTDSEENSSEYEILAEYSQNSPSIQNFQL